MSFDTRPNIPLQANWPLSGFVYCCFGWRILLLAAQCKSSVCVGTLFFCRFAFVLWRSCASVEILPSIRFESWGLRINFARTYKHTLHLKCSMRFTLQINVDIDNKVFCCGQLCCVIRVNCGVTAAAWILFSPCGDTQKNQPIGHKTKFHPLGMVDIVYSKQRWNAPNTASHPTTQSN